MKDIKERVAIVEQVAASAHKRIDGVDMEIKSLRDSRYEHNGLLHAHGSLLSSMDVAMTELSTSVNKLTNFANKLIWVTVGGVGVGATLIGIMLYILKEFLQFY